MGSLIIVRPLPLDGSNKEKFCIKKCRVSPIIIVPSYILNYESQYRDSTYSLIWCNKETEGDGCDLCSFCNRLLDKTIGYYVCNKFSNSNNFIVGFHKECIEPIQNNPYHPKHSLRALMYHLEGGRQCYCCCGNKKSFHFCSICDFGICHECVQEQPLLTIKHQIMHKHTLNYIHRKASITCNICALDYQRYFIYMCYQCDFVVHKECIYFPSIIRISHHDHRLNFTSSYLPSLWFCEICNDIYDENYGGYFCVLCYYFVHTKCVIGISMSAENELEGKPEDTYDNIYCSKCNSRPFSMRFHKDIDKANGKEYKCQGCALPIYDGDIFSCIKCDLVLHRVCARLPLTKLHMTHPHPLRLNRDTILDTTFKCSTCKRLCNSFQYRCKFNACDFHIDLNCAFISEALNYHSHNHLLFLPSKIGSSGICLICQNSREYYLECEECDFALCFGCATLPKKLMYKHDEHFLIFSFGKDASDQYWCDICEDIINQKYGIYMCNDCNIALHVGCLCGEDMYMLPGRKVILYVNGGAAKSDILLNNRLTRYICKYCHKRCQYKSIFKNVDNDVFCSGSCLVISMTGNDF